ncbi:tetratricopeptide repeat protein [Liquorilactobacillus uvarum]|uniref:Tetratricopeptide repeat protein n=1 Tax=Liquorilactobacillus uvarum DSM 19971 TaxID=1423812 RepID=A0A0R1Q213_9LACO|nr:tetratricopeptide repeat protein [Liquorilactobacillus uvarum]KRL38711.1 hypothetical protein FD20_GL001429 [Liquorilactobacillus uvarum DSM 19971]
MKKQKEAIEEAAQSVRKMVAAVDKAPNNPQVYYNLGAMLTELKNYQQAEELFKKALHFFKNDDQKAILHYGLGNVFYASGLYKEAIGEFQQIKQNKLKLEALLMIAQAEYAQDNYQFSLAYALTVAEEKNDHDSLMLVGENFLALGNFVQAEKYFDKVLAEWPDDKKANFQRGIVGIVEGEKSEAFFEKVKKNNPEYFKKMKSRLVDVEKFVATRKKGVQGGK